MALDCGRLDQFTDGAFAFSITLLLIGGTDPVASQDDLRRAFYGIPAFAIGFALLGMFWLTHVRWRTMRGEGGVMSVILTLSLIFLVLIFVRPLQAMAMSFADYLGAPGGGFRASVSQIFLSYGAAFVPMTAVTAGLFLDIARDQDRDAQIRRLAYGETGVWLILSATGLLSLLLSLSRVTAGLAPWAYATLPVSVGLFCWLYPWEAPAPPEPPLLSESEGDKAAA